MTIDHPFPQEEEGSPQAGGAGGGVPHPHQERPEEVHPEAEICAGCGALLHPVLPEELPRLQELLPGDCQEQVRGETRSFCS